MGNKRPTLSRHRSAEFKMQLLLGRKIQIVVEYIKEFLNLESTENRDHHNQYQDRPDID